MDIFEEIKTINIFSNGIRSSPFNKYNSSLELYEKSDFLNNLINNTNKTIHLFERINSIDSFTSLNYILLSTQNYILGSKDYLNNRDISLLENRLNIKNKYLIKIAEKVGVDHSDYDLLFKQQLDNIKKITNKLGYKEFLDELYFFLFHQQNNELLKSNDNEKLITQIKSLFDKHIGLNNLEDSLRDLKTLEIDLNTEDTNQLFKFKETFDVLVTKIRQKNINYFSSFADKYLYSSSDLNPTTKFLIEKQLESKIQVDLKLSKSQENSRYILFEDGSLITFDKNSKMTSHEDISKFQNLINSDTLKFIFRKNPTLYKFINSIITQDDYYENAFVFSKTILNNINTIKNTGIKIESLKNKSFEVMDDYINQLIDKEKIKAFTYSIVSNKYKHLINEHTINIFKNFYDSSFDASKIQSLVGKKIAAFNTPEDFNLFASNILEKLTEFKEDLFIDKINLMNIEPVYAKDNIYVIEINTFNESKSLGSPQWCIARDDFYFTQYKSSDNKQFFIYDFNRSSEDNRSMIGFTLYNDGSFYTQHLKNDDSFSVDKDLTKIRDEIVINNLDKFNISENFKDEIESRLNINKNTIKLNKGTI